jgi:hypothetical protein
MPDVSLLPNIRLLNAQSARAALPDLCEVLSDCVVGGASVGFMLPYGPDTAEPYWQGVIDNVASGATLLFVAEVDGEVLGTVQIGMSQMPNQPHRADLKKLLVLILL